MRIKERPAGRVIGPGAERPLTGALAEKLAADLMGRLQSTLAQGLEHAREAVRKAAADETRAFHIASLERAEAAGDGSEAIRERMAADTIERTVRLERELDVAVRAGLARLGPTD